MLQQQDPFEGVQTIVFDDESQWLAGRGPTVGSSEVAALVGLGYANQSAMTIWAQKTNQDTPDWSDEQKQWLAIGKAGEPFARFCFEVKTGLSIFHDRQLTVRINPDYPAFGASIDSWTFIDGKQPEAFEPGDDLAVVEIKIIHPRDTYQYMVDELPPKFTIQIQHQMASVGANHGYLCAVCGTEVIVKYVPRHDRLIDGLHQRAVEFLECVRSGTPPEIDGSEATKDCIIRMFPDVEPESVCELPPEFNGFAQERDEHKEKIKYHTEAADKIDSQVRYYMKDAEFAVQSDGEAFSWKKAKSGRRTFNRLKKVPAPVRKVLRGLETGA